MNDAACGKTMENLRNKIDAKLVSNKRDYLKWISKPSLRPHKVFDNDLFMIRKSKVTLTLNKPENVAMCMICIILKINMVTTPGFFY